MKWLCCLSLLLLILVISYGEEESNLLSELQKVAGVFSDPSLVTKYDLDHTIMVVAANYGYLQHLFNFDCFARRLGMKFLVMSLDEKIHAHLKQHTKLISHLFDRSSEDHQRVGISPAAFRTKQFNLITTRKNEAVYEILSLGFNVLFSDADVAILDNPFPYLLWQGMDYVHSLNNPCSMYV